MNCSGCGVFVQNCPTGALSAQISRDPSTFKLIFDHAKCIACCLCANICPKKCIEVNKALDFARLNDSDEVIFENEFMCCRNCGKPYATKSMIDILKHKLGSMGELSAEWAEYCPSCRVAIQQKR